MFITHVFPGGPCPGKGGSFSSRASSAAWACLVPLRQLPLNYTSVSQRPAPSSSGSCSPGWERLKWISLLTCVFLRHNIPPSHRGLIWPLRFISLLILQALFPPVLSIFLFMQVLCTEVPHKGSSELVFAEHCTEGDFVRENVTRADMARILLTP